MIFLKASIFQKFPIYTQAEVVFGFKKITLAKVYNLRKGCHPKSISLRVYKLNNNAIKI